MAITVIKDGFGQVEPNRCSFLHDGNIESQCAAKTDLENGKIVTIDRATKKDTKEQDVMGLVAEAKDMTVGFLGLNYTAEKLYEVGKPGRKNFKVKAGEYPRVGILKVGDIFTTNAYLPSPKTPATTTTASVTLGDYLQGDGTHKASPESRIKVVEITDTADGQTAVKYMVVK